MKNIFPILFCTTFFCVFGLASKSQCAWQAVGPDDFAQAYYTPAEFGSIVIDSYGTPYFASADGKAIVRKFDGKGWITVGAPNFSVSYILNTKLAFSPTGILYIGYNDAGLPGNNVVVKKFDGVNWVSVGSPSQSLGPGYFSSIAFDKGGLPCIAMQDSANGQRISVLRFNGTTWTYLETPRFTPQKAGIASLAFDQSGTAFVAFEDSLGVLVMKYTGTNWVNVGPLVNTSIGNWIDLAIDGNGIPYVSFCDSGVYGKLMKYNGTKWEQQGGSFLNTGLQSCSMAIDKFNVPYVTFSDLANNDHVTVQKYMNGWVTVGKPGCSTFASAGTAMALDPITGKPWFVYFDKNYFEYPYVMSFDGTAWKTEGPIGIDNGETGPPSLAIDTSNIPYIAFADYENKKHISVFKFMDTAWVNVGPAHFIAQHAGFDKVDLKIDQHNTPFIAFTDSAPGAKVTVMKYTDTNWVNVGNKAFSSNSAESISLAVDKNSTPYVSFSSSWPDNHPSVMKFDGSTWIHVGNPGFMPCNSYITNIVVDESGTPYVSFCDSTKGQRISVMKFNGTAWVYVGQPGISNSPLYFPNTTVFYFSMAVSKTGILYLAYPDSTLGYKETVKSFDGSNWNLVGAQGFTPTRAYESNMTLDNLDNPVVVYSDNRLHVMAFDGSNWFTLGNVLNPAQANNPVIAINKKGVPYVGYRNYEAFVRRSDCNTTGITELPTMKSSISVYPNPSSSLFTLDLGASNFQEEAENFSCLTPMVN
jgi:hypothetical protein